MAFVRRKIDKAAFRKPADIEFLYDISIYWPETRVHYIIFNVILIENRFFFFYSRFKILKKWWITLLYYRSLRTSGELSDVLHPSSADVLLLSDLKLIVYDDVRRWHTTSWKTWVHYFARLSFGAGCPRQGLSLDLCPCSGLENNKFSWCYMLYSDVIATWSQQNINWRRM